MALKRLQMVNRHKHKCSEWSGARQFGQYDYWGQNLQEYLINGVEAGERSLISGAASECVRVAPEHLLLQLF